MDQQFPVLKSKNKSWPAIRAILAIVLLAGVAIGAYYVSGRVSGRQAIAPTAPVSEPFALTIAQRNAAACAAAKCKSNEVCKGEGNCVWQKPKDENAYVCTSTNCPAPAWRCTSSTNCWHNSGYFNGHLIGGACSTSTGAGTYNASGVCVKTNVSGECAAQAGMQCSSGGKVGTIKADCSCANLVTLPGGTTACAAQAGMQCSSGGKVGTIKADCSCANLVTLPPVDCKASQDCAPGVKGGSSCKDPGTGEVRTCCPSGVAIFGSDANKTCGAPAAYSCPSCQVGSCEIGFGAGNGTCDPAGAAKKCCVWVATVDTIKCGTVECDQATSKCCPSGCKPKGTECGGGGTTTTTACTDTTWTPSPATICTTATLTQTSNCNKTRTVSGTKVCSVVGACTELKIYKKNADGTFGATPLTTAELGTLKINDTLQLASKGSIASLKARFKISIDSTEESPGWRDSSAYKDTAKTISVFEYKITKPGKYKFEAEVSSKP